ncbi:hypothetical protein WICPIJ_006178 [Wickerhamomyces pijperi]|uniref:Uncharacterized protein n=1 Tax=Wickerhamomyces pijperi TaxID=599730 RepID=A0A9P8Q4R4_WICPI|nr:hypothetical protein WICPIJ_006178 [Wickerhamomyces pijperi]
MALGIFKSSRGQQQTTNRNENISSPTSHIVGGHSQSLNKQITLLDVCCEVAQRSKSQSLITNTNNKSEVAWNQEEWDTLNSFKAFLQPLRERINCVVTELPQSVGGMIKSPSTTSKMICYRMR